MISNALSRLASRSYRAETNEFILNIIEDFSVSVIIVSEAFRRRLLDGYQESRWARAIVMIKTNDRLGDNSVKLSYKLIENLLYFNDDEKSLRLYISSVIKAEMFKLAHDKMRYSKYARTYERLTQDLYIYNMTIKLHEFIRHCSHYQLNQTSRYKFYDLL